MILYLCFLQEHWLHSDHLSRINEISHDFTSVSVSGMDSGGSLLCGRPLMVAVQSCIENPSLHVLYLLPLVLSDSVLLKCLTLVVYQFY